MPKVFAVYEPEHAHRIREWVGHWEAEGWTPQLISQRELREAGSIRKAIKKRAGKSVTKHAPLRA